MIPKGCKRLAEVDFPIAEVSRHAAREKSIRHGHPSTLHLWWARRPLASSRAMLLGLLWPDPCDPLCPLEFKEQARKLLPAAACNPGTTDKELRKALLKFIGAFANWDLATNRTYLEVSRALVKAAHGEEPPLVVDPFAGGGSIPLEALRLGCETFASDLNPVACLILKVLLEDIPRHGPSLADELRRVGAEIKQRAEVELADLYPDDPDGATPIAYLWARTVRCESPKCGAEIPLVRSFWLCKKAKRRRALKCRVVRRADETPRVKFEVFEPNAEKEVPGGTVTRAKATCLACGVVMPPARVRAQLTVQRGGADVVFDSKGQRAEGARMLAVVTLRRGELGRRYRLSDERDYEGVRIAQNRVAEILAEWERGGKKGLCPVPNEPLPAGYSQAFPITTWGPTTWGDLTNVRQKAVLLTISQVISELPIAESALAKALIEILSLLFSKYSEMVSSNCPWEPMAECPRKVFSMQALPARWEYAEGVPTSSSSGSWAMMLDNMDATLSAIGSDWRIGQTMQADAREAVLPASAASVWFTDPPYYDAVPYADLSDFFFVWLKRTLLRHSLTQGAWLSPLGLTPKAEELCLYKNATLRDRPPKDAEFFERGVMESFVQGATSLSDSGVGCVVFAHKTTEGWEALLDGVMKANWVIKASWPVQTEQVNRPRARDAAALQGSVHLVCRPRPDDAPVGDWVAVLRELPKRVGDWMERLQGEGVRGADLVFACIGPALEIFSRYAKVETAEGREVALAEYLEKVWEVVGRSALAQVLGTSEAMTRNGAAGAVEEDARLTALFLWTLQSTSGGTEAPAESEDHDEELPEEDDDDEGPAPTKAKGFTLVFDVVRRFAQPLGIELPQWEGRVIETKKGVVRLLPISERARQLFGEDGAQVVAARLEREAAVGTNPLQEMLFPEMEAGPKVRGRGRVSGRRAGVEVSNDSLAATREATTLDRVHAAMLLQAGGRTNALRALLKSEQERGSEFLRLANALSALYPKGSEEKRLLDAMLLAAPR